MSELAAVFASHPVGEESAESKREIRWEPGVGMAVDTCGRRVRVEWDPDAVVTPLGQMVFFAQFLAAGGLFSGLVANCPLRYTSSNAPSLSNLLGTMVLGILSGQQRYAHLNALREDSVNPPALGMTKTCSEDSVRRAFGRSAPQTEVEDWLRGELRRACEPGLNCGGWVLDIDVTVKPIYGQQEGAKVGYNPHKPGRPSHAYHNYVMASLRLVLDVEVLPGNEHAAKHGCPGLWRLWESFRPEERPLFIRGDAAYGHEALLCQCEERGQGYVFRLRMTKGVKTLVAMLEVGAQQSGGSQAWQDVGGGWSAREGELQLQGWSAKRRVVVLRHKVSARRPRTPARAGQKPSAECSEEVAVTEVAATKTVRSTDRAPRENGQSLLEWSEPVPVGDEWEYQILVTNTKLSLAEMGSSYRQRGDCENAYDELKNQWGWGGYTTRCLFRSAVAARLVALVYNWWVLFVRALEPTRPREAVTSRPLLLCAVGRLISHAGGQVLRLTSTHAQAELAQKLQTDLSLFLSGMFNAAEQLDATQRWQRIWHRIAAPFRDQQLPRLRPAPS